MGQFQIGDSYRISELCKLVFTFETFDQGDEQAKPDQRPKTKTKTMTNTCEIEV